MKTKLLRKTRAYIRKHHHDFQYRIKESQHDIMSNVAVEIVENAFYLWKWGFNTSAYEILVKRKLFNN